MQCASIRIASSRPTAYDFMHFKLRASEPRVYYGQTLGNIMYGDISEIPKLEQESVAE